jgi:alkanesulfonate monooxygenase SsuD/methylene tetrahydromethanopterin reductase-like flavin-dependent oxidoreductase (luciferase family)
LAGPPRAGVLFRAEWPPERLRAFVLAAEAVGLDDVWLCEDCFLAGGLTTAAAALGWTASVRVGLGLMPVPLRTPALAAMEIGTLARLFPGRFVPAVWHGVQAWMQQVGARAASPMTLLREWVSTVRALLAGQAVTSRGRYVRLDGVVLDWPPSVVPPLLVGSRSPKTIALAGQVADGLLLPAGVLPGQVRAAVAAAAADRPCETVVYATAGTRAEAAAVIRRYAEAGATTVVLVPAVDDADVAATIELAGRARSVLHGDVALG